jgi:hypothetical protein
MKKPNDKDLFGVTFALFDYRSGTFRQKMYNHFEATGRKRWIDIEPMREKKYEPVISFKANIGPRAVMTTPQQPLCCSTDLVITGS